MIADLAATCARFCRAVSRHDLAESAALVVAAAQSAIRDGVSTSAGSALIRGAAWSRRSSCMHAVQDVRNWHLCDPLSLIESGPWDTLHLLLFLCECHMRACMARLFSENKGWCDSWFDGQNAANEVDAAFAQLVESEAHACRAELECGIEPLSVRAALAEKTFLRTAASLTVCLDGLVSEEFRRDDDLFSDTRLSRLGVRLIERHSIDEDATRCLSEFLESFPPELNVPELMGHSKHISGWLTKTVRVEANNTLLLRLDEWAVVCALTSKDIAFATGERGTVPQEHRTGAAAWVAMRALPDDAYRKLMRESKKNDEHPENAYIAFSGALEQYHGFDWIVRCFVARIRPVCALRKTKEWVQRAHTKSPPLVVQGPVSGHATVLIMGANGIVHRVSCADPSEALSVWMSAVARHNGGAISRKANVRDIVARIADNAVPLEALVSQHIGGAKIDVVFN